MQCCEECPTFVCVLSCKLSNCIANLGPDRVIGLVSEALQQLRANSLALWCLKRQEEVCGLTGLGLARLGGLSPEDDSGKCTGL